MNPQSTRPALTDADAAADLAGTPRPDWPAGTPELSPEVIMAERDTRAAARALTFGEKAVGLTFNPGNNPDVDACKREFAACIDRMNDLRASASSSDVKRHASVAITELESAQMRAVKALTWKD